MNDSGRSKIWDALCYGTCAGELGVSIEPFTHTNPDMQHEFVEVRVRGNDGSQKAITALGQAGLLFLGAQSHLTVTDEDSPRLELLHNNEIEGPGGFKDRQLLFVDRTVALRFNNN